MAKTIQLNGHTYEVMRPSYARQAYEKYLDSSDVTLDDVYGRCSQAKRNAYDYCRARERELNSFDGVIASHNINHFTYAFTCFWEGERYFVFITKSHDYAIALEDF